MDSYLIQRASFRNDPNRKGIDMVLTFDYMGSAEFEFGALPASLKRIRSNSKDYIQFEHTIKGYNDRPLTILCQRDQKEDVINLLPLLANKKIRLKERCDLDAYLAGERSSDLWWDIDNDFFFWRTDKDFSERFDVLLFGKAKV
jgi:hypothetical protein